MKNNNKHYCPSCFYNFKLKEIKSITRKNKVVCPNCRKWIDTNNKIPKLRKIKIVEDRTLIPLKPLPQQKVMEKGLSNRIPYYTKITYIKDFYNAVRI